LRSEGAYVHPLRGRSSALVAAWWAVWVRSLLRSRSFRPGVYRLVGVTWVRDSDREVPAQLADGKSNPRTRRVSHAQWILPSRPIRNLRGVGTFDYLVQKADQGLLLAPEAGVVRRVGPGVVVDGRYEVLRNRLGAFVGSPAFTVDFKRQTIDEEYVEGRICNQEGVEERVASTKHILRSIASLVESERGGEVRGRDRTSDFLRLMFATCTPQALPAELGQISESFMFARIFGSGPVIPSHGEVGPHNVLHAQNGYLLIDWEPKSLGVRPFWADACNAIQAAGWPLFLEGRFDEQLSQLWSVAGFESHEWTKLRDQVAAGAAVAALSRRVTLAVDMPEGGDIHLFSLPRWAKLRHIGPRTIVARDASRSWTTYRTERDRRTEDGSVAGAE